MSHFGQNWWKVPNIFCFEKNTLSIKKKFYSGLESVKKLLQNSLQKLITKSNVKIKVFYFYYCLTNFSFYNFFVGLSLQENNLTVRQNAIGENPQKSISLWCFHTRKHYVLWTGKKGVTDQLWNKYIREYYLIVPFLFRIIISNKIPPTTSEKGS